MRQKCSTRGTRSTTTPLMYSDGFHPIVFTISPPPLTNLVHPKDLARAALSPTLSTLPRAKPCTAMRMEGKEERKKNKKKGKKVTHPSTCVLDPHQIFHQPCSSLTFTHPCHSPQLGHALPQREREEEVLSRGGFTSISLTHSPPCSLWL